MIILSTINRTKPSEIREVYSNSLSYRAEKSGDEMSVAATATNVLPPFRHRLQRENEGDP
jgi:hypothetical protein